IATATIVPPREPIPIVKSTDKPVVTLVYTRKPKAKNVPNKMKPNKSWGSSSNVSSSPTDCRLFKSSFGSASEGFAKKKGRTVAVTTEDMQKKRNYVKAKTTLLLALPDEHQLRFSKYKTAQELWAAILKTFGGNEATNKTKKNQLKQQYDNFKAERKETLEQTFNKLQAIVSHLEFMDVEIEQDDLN
nr:ribonuclease H-like domain-containing protein [Tanacetum cinerariifolium]